MYNISSWINETNPEVLIQYCMVLLAKSGFKILQVIDNHFEPQGYTALFLLAESHFAIHTFPEKGQTYIELTSCAKEPFDAFIKHFNLT